jgi:hypothetical protein
MARQNEPKIFNVLIQIEDGGSVAKCHAIHYKGALWLVPKWLDNPSEQITRPERIVLLDKLPMQPGGTFGNHQADFVLNVAVPKSVLEGPIQSQSIGNFVVIGLPDIEFPMKSVPRI